MFSEQHAAALRNFILGPIMPDLLTEQLLWNQWIGNRATRRATARTRPGPARPALSLSRNSRSNGLDFDDLKAQLGSLFLEQFDLLAAVTILVVLHSFVYILLAVLQHSVH